MIPVDSIICGDCLELMKDIEDNSVDLVLTDPPYLKDYLYTYDYLANQCPRLMKIGASLLTIAPHYALKIIMDKFQDKLKYRWILCMNQFEGSHPRMAMGIEVMWKPILWYVKNSYPQGRGYVRDGFVIDGNEGVDKKYHKWQQDLSWAMYCIKKFSNENDLILDPFLGSGTTAVACIKTNRHYIGIELDEAYCKIAQQRVDAENAQLKLEGI